MKKLSEALNNLTQSMTNVQTNGQTGQADSPASHSTKLTASTATQGTGQLQMVKEKLTGLLSSVTGAEGPNNREVAITTARNLLGVLPYTLESWLHGKMLSETDFAGHGLEKIYGYDRRQPLELSDEDRLIASEVLNALRVVYSSCRERKQHRELTSLLMTLFSMTPFGTKSDEVTQSLKVEGWLSEVEKYPMWSVKQAFEWDKEIKVELTLGVFIASIRQAAGSEGTKYRLLHEVLNKGVRN